MFAITGGGTIFVSFLLTVACIVCAVVYGHRFRGEGHHAAWGVLARSGIVFLAILCGCITVLLLFNRVTLTVTSFGDLDAFLYLLGFSD